MKKILLLSSLLFVTAILFVTAMPSFAQLTVSDPAGLAQAIKRLEAIETQIQNQEKHILIAQQHLQTTSRRGWSAYCDCNKAGRIR